MTLKRLRHLVSESLAKRQSNPVRQSTTDRDLPAQIVLKRIAIRTLPDGKSIALYQEPRSKIIMMFPPSFTE